jgi:hypothetical protein
MLTLPVTRTRPHAHKHDIIGFLDYVDLRVVEYLVSPGRGNTRIVLVQGRIDEVRPDQIIGAYPYFLGSIMLTLPVTRTRPHAHKSDPVEPRTTSKTFPYWLP